MERTWPLTSLTVVQQVSFENLCQILCPKQTFFKIRKYEKNKPPKPPKQSVNLTLVWGGGEEGRINTFSPVFKSHFYHVYKLFKIPKPQLSHL